MASNLTVTIGADASKLRAELAVAQAALRDATREMNSAARQAARTGDELAFAKTGQGAANVSAITAQVDALKRGMEQAAQTGQVLTNTLRVNRSGMLEMQAAGVNAFQALASGMDPFRVAMTEGAQVMGGLVQAGIVGFGALLSPLGLLAGAGLAAGGAIGYMAYQAYQARQTLGGMQAELLLTGRAGSTAIDDAARSAENLANKFDISKRSAAEVLAEIAKARTLNSEQIEQLAQLAAAEGKARRAAGSDIKDVDIAKAMAAALGDGAAGAIKLAQSYNIATSAAEQMLKSGNELGAFRTVIDDLANHIRTHGGAWSEAKTKYDEYKSAVEKFFNLPPIAAQILGLSLPPKPTDRPSGGAGLDQGPVVAAAPLPGTPFGDSLNRMIAAARAAGLDIGITSGTRSRERQQQLWDEALRKYGSEAEARKWVAPPGSSMHERGLAADLSFGPGAREWAHANAAQFGINFPLGNEPWHAEPTGARTGGAATAFADKSARERAQRDVEQGYREQEIANRNSLQAQIAAAEEHKNKLANLIRDSLKDNKNLSEQEIEETIRKDSRIEAAELDLKQKKAALYDQDTGRAIAALRAQAAASTEIRDRIGIQQRIIGTLQSRGAPVTEIDAARTELASLQRQASQDAVSIEQEKLGRLTQMGQLELQAFTAREELLVAQRRQSQDQAVAHEAAATDALLTKRREGAQALVDLAEQLGMSAREVLKFKDAVQQIDIERGTRAAQFATKEAQAQQAIVDKWAQPLKSAFEQIGSSIEGAVTGILTRQKTFANAFKEIENSVISSVISGGGSILSKLGAKALGDTTGGGIGEFLGNKLLGTLGIGGEAAGAAALTGSAGALTGAAGALTGAAGALTAASGTSAAGGAVSGGGGIFSFLSGAASIAAFARGGIVPSAAGGWALPSFAGAQPALLHSREMVLPERISTGLQAAISGGGGLGGGGTVINLSAIDSRTGAQFLMSHAETIGRALNRSRRNFQPA